MKTFFMVVTYWTGRLSSKPHSSRMRWISASVGVRPAIRCAGSPLGMTLKIRNVSTEMANSTNTIEMRRRTMKRSHQRSIRTLARGSRASRTPSPNTFSDSTVSTSIKPGTIVR